MKGFCKMKSVTRGLALLLAILLAVPTTPIRVQAETVSGGDTSTQESESTPKGGEVIKKVTFSDETAYTATANGNTIETRTDADGNEYLYIAKTTNASCNVQFYLTEEEIAKITAEKGFVLDCDLTLEQIKADSAGNSSYVDFFSSQDVNGNWAFKFKDANKRAYVIDGGVVLYGAGRFQDFPIDSQKHHISLAYDLENDTVKLYVDGEERPCINGDGSARSNAIPADYIPKMFQLGAWSSGGDVSFAVDNFRIYLGTVLRTAEQDAAEENTAKGGEVIKKVTFSDETAYTATANGNTIETRTDADGNEYLYIAKTTNASCNVQFYLTEEEIAKITAEKGFVLDCDLTLEQIKADSAGNSSYVDFFSSQDVNGNWAFKFKDANKRAYVIDGGVVLYGAGRFQDFPIDSQKHHISLAYDLENDTVKLYVDGEERPCINGDGSARSNAIPADYIPKMFQLGAWSSGGDVSFAVDNFRIYLGTVLRTAEQDADEEDEDISGGNGEGGSTVTPDNFNSIQETVEDALKHIGANDLLVMVNNGAYIWQKEKKTSDVLPYLEGSVVMIPKTLAEACFGDLSGKNVTTAEKDGHTFLSLQELCNVLNRHFYWDDRGFAVASEQEFTLRNSAEVQVQGEPIDMIYRYLQFERPSGMELAKIIKENNPNNNHPRLLGTAAEFEQLRKNVAENERMAGWAESIIKNADSYIAAGVVKYELTPNLVPVANQIHVRMLFYSVAYVLTGDEKYVDAAWRDAQYVCEEYPDWCAKHFLGTAEISFGIAVAYDTFYNEWDDEQKKIVRDAMIRNSFQPMLETYSGQREEQYWIKRYDNWTSVCAGGVLAAAIAMVDEEDAAPYCEKLLGETVQSFEIVSSMFYPDGAWYESAHYMRYTVEFMFAGIHSLMTATGGRDFGLLDAAGMEKAPAYLLSIHGMAEGAFNFHNGSSKGMVINGALLWLANALGMDGFQNQYMTLAETQGYGTKVPLLLLSYDPSLEASTEEVPLDQYFSGADVGVMRSAWTTNSIWAGVHAGQNGIDNAQLDLGEFIFEADGIRWVTDLGSDTYLPGYFEERGFDIYRQRPEANNCLLINPRVGYQGQTLKCTTELLRQESDDRGAIIAFDLTNAYTADASKVIRGFMLGDDRRSFLIRDEVEGIKQANSEIYWFMNLSEDVTDIQMDTENQTSVFKTDGGEELQLSFWTDAEVLEFGTMPCVPLETSPTYEGMADDSGKNKFYIKLKATDSMNLSVKLVPQISYVDDIAPADETAIADWSIDEGTLLQKPVLSSISLDGKPLREFVSDDYTYLMSWRTDKELPEVTAVNPDPNVVMTVTQPTWDQPAKITLKGADGSISEYRIVLEGKDPMKVPEGYEALDIVDVKVSEIRQPENGPDNAIDGDPTTRWSAPGSGQWIEIDLGEEKHFDALWMAFYNGGIPGAERITTFDLLVSSDGETYETIYTSQKTKPENETCSIYELSGTGRFIRFVGLSNSDGSAWVSVNEMIPVVKIGDSQEGQELTAAKEAAKKALEEIRSDKDAYSEENWSKVEAELQKALTAIEAAETADGVNQALADAKNAIDSIQTLEEENAGSSEPDSDENAGSSDSDSVSQAPEIVESATDDSYILGSNAEVTIKSTGDFAKFESVAMDGQIVDESNYTVKEGSTIVTFKTEYLETLSVGTHTVTINYKDGSDVDHQLTILKNMDVDTDTDTKDEADTESDNADIPVVDGSAENNQADQTSSPSTGDSSSVGMWAVIALAAVVIALAAAMNFRRKK